MLGVVWIEKLFSVFNYKNATFSLFPVFLVCTENSENKILYNPVKIGNKMKTM